LRQVIPNFAGMVDAEVYGMAQSGGEFAEIAKHVYGLRYSLSRVLKAEFALRDLLEAKTPADAAVAVKAAEDYFATMGTAPRQCSAFVRAAVSTPIVMVANKTRNVGKTEVHPEGRD
jgi:hypothetical protein